MPTPLKRAALAGLVATAALAAQQSAVDPSPPRWRQHDINRRRPAVVEPAEAPIASKPPADAVVLFDGSNLDAWKSGGGPARWRVVDGAMETVPGAGQIETKKSFGDIQLHVEWAAPDPPHGKGQDRGNSGVFLMGQFEVQVLDSYKAETYADGQAGAIYGQFPPLFNASRPPGQWQSYDIAFRRPRFEAGKLVDPARITLFHNGILVQCNEEPFGPTSWLKWLPYRQGDRGPIALQDHDHPVRYRNLWLRELPERAAPPRVAAPSYAMSTDDLDAYAGRYRLGSRGDNSAAVVAREGDHLTVTFPWRPGPLELRPTSPAEFEMPSTDGGFRFRKDAAGKVSGVRFRIGDGEREMDRIAH